MPITNRLLGQNDDSQFIYIIYLQDLFTYEHRNFSKVYLFIWYKNRDCDDRCFYQIHTSSGHP